MKIAENRTMATLIALFLVLTIAVTLVALPAANAHTPAWTIPTYAYVTVSPNPVGVGQTVTVVVWLDKMPAGTSVGNDIRFKNFKVTITKPDKTTETISWPICTDSSSSAYSLWTPDQVGTYSFVFDYAGQVYTWSGDYQNDTYAASTSKPAYLTVQQEPIPAPPSYPLPTEYWTRPIEGQNTNWWKISSHWLRGSQIVGGIVQLDGIAPNSAHVMWTKPLQDGGVVGGSRTGIEGMTYYDGSAYEGKGRNSLIMQGRFYYALPQSNNPSGGGYACVDLRTGKTLFWQNMTLPSFGQLLDFESGNQHGVIPNGYLWSSNFANAYDPLTGNWLFSRTDVPSGTEVYGPNGEITRYVLNVAGKWLALWNSTAVQALGDLSWRPVGKTVNASKAYSWNVTIPTLPTGATVQAVIPDDLLLGINGSLPSATSWAPYTMWAISLKPASRGTMLWMKNYAAPAGNLSRSIRQVDPVNRVFIKYDQQVMQYWGYSLDDGSLLWGPTPSEAPLNFYALTTGMFGAGASAVAYGKLYSTGYSGIVYCYDTKNGSLLWNYSAPGGLAVPSGAYSLLIGAIADGKVYLSSYEHSANAPHWKGSQMHCVDAYTGEKTWTIAGWFADYSMCVADGYLVSLNDYNMQIYCFGKGPSATTVTGSPKVSVHGSSVLVEGTVIDTATGTKQDEQAARFPNGVPAMSDASMGAWMEYVYMQKPRPADAVGVEVTLDAVDPNGNWIHIGTATSDSSGLFKKAFTPEVPGEYTVIATFAGSESYWPSYAETAIFVSEAPPATPPPPAAQPLPPIEMYFIAATVAIIIAVAIATVLILRKRP